MVITFLGTSGIDDASPHGRWLPLSQELARAGHVVELVLLHPTYDMLRPRRWSLDGVQVTHVGQMHVYGYPGNRRYFGPLRLAQIAIRGALSLAAYAVRLRPDVIHLAKPQPINGLAGVLAARALGRGFYVDCDDYEAAANRFGGAWQRHIVSWWEDRLPVWARGVTVNTRYLWERCQRLGVTPERLRYVPNGIRAAQLVPPSTDEVRVLRQELALDDAPVVLYFGTMSNVAHGVSLLIEAFALVLRDLPQARLLMVGDGDDRVALQTQAKRLGIHGSLCWTGRVPAAQIRMYLALAHCSVDPVFDSPGARGRSPLKIVESLAQGVPVVTGAVGDRSAIVTQEAGIVVAPGDSRALADGILRLLNDSQLRMKLATGARVRAESLCWRHLALTWLSLYE